MNAAHDMTTVLTPEGYRAECSCGWHATDPNPEHLGLAAEFHHQHAVAANDDVPTCGRRKPDGFGLVGQTCQRPRGHDGPHEGRSIQTYPAPRWPSRAAAARES